MRHRLLILLVLTAGLTSSAHAGIIFGRKKDKLDPKQRVPELVMILKSDKDSDKRSRAAEELRYYDPAQYPEIIPALIGALQNDERSSVRIDALQSLSRMRPVTQQVGEALEQALSRDPSMRVRLQARSALLQYHWAGYRSGKKPEVPPLTPSREPPLADKDKYPPAVNSTIKPGSAPAPVAPPLPPSSYNPRTVPPMTPPNVTTQEPPLASPLPAPEQLKAPAPVSAPPAQPIPMPLPPPMPMGSSTPAQEGPDLGPNLR